VHRDYVLLRAEMPVIPVLSNCPQQNNPSSGFRPTPIEVTGGALYNELSRTPVCAAKKSDDA
jgi:uncharacterized protein YcgI (DUF1989 family)